MPQNISSDFFLQESGENSALIGIDVSEEVENSCLRLVPAKGFSISSSIAKHHFTLGIKGSKTEVTEAVIYIRRANHTALQLLAHVILTHLLCCRPRVYAARYA